MSIDSSWPLKLFADGAGDHSTPGGWTIPQCTAAESEWDGESGGEGEKTGKLTKRLVKVHIVSLIVILLLIWLINVLKWSWIMCLVEKRLLLNDQTFTWWTIKRAKTNQNIHKMLNLSVLPTVCWCLVRWRFFKQTVTPYVLMDGQTGRS